MMRTIESGGPSLEKRPNFENISSYYDLALVVMLQDGDKVNSGWSDMGPGTPDKGISRDKVEWLMDTSRRYKADQWWIYDTQGRGHNLGEIIRKFNPDWQEGVSWLSGVGSEEERRDVIEKAWLEACNLKAMALAEDLGGTAYQLSNPSMESGLATVVMLNDHASENLVFRGVRNQSRDVLDRQVCGMLRTGIDDKGNDADGPVNRERLSQVVEDQDIQRAVYELADNPNMERMETIIKLYEDKGLTQLWEQATDALRNVKYLMNKYGHSFPEALRKTHLGLMEANIGNSPYVATSSDMGDTNGFTGKSGMVLVCSISKPRASDLIAPGETLIKGRIDRSEIMAIVPINRQLPEGKSRDLKREETDFRQAGEEITTFLQIKFD
jgi:hypothetical protein